MVGFSQGAAAHNGESLEAHLWHNSDQFKWTSVSLGEVVDSEHRLEASVYGIEGREVREVLDECRWPLKTICGPDGTARAYHCPRFKRIFVDRSGLAIYQPAQITEVNPKPTAYISGQTPTDIEKLRVRRNQVLLTRSGTIGETAFVGDTLNGRIFSDDLIRIETHEPDDAGYLYAFLRSEVGNTLVNTNNYGSVVGHIEPAHLENLPIPDPSPVLKGQIHEKIEDSFRLRDESNVLMEEAQNLLLSALKLPSLEELEPKSFDNEANVQNFSVGLAELEGRLEASYHPPIVRRIEDHLREHAAEVKSVGDRSISERVILPGRFARVYVEEGQGVVTGPHALYQSR